MKNKTKIFATVFLVLVLTGIISAAGISSPYWKDHPLYMNYGETKNVNFNLQNMVGDQDITVEVTLKKGLEIASLEKTTYTAKIGTSDTMIPLTISIPEDYNGGIQQVELEVKTIEQESDGMITLNTGWIVSFNVIVSQEEVSNTSLTTIIVGLIIVIIILAIIITIILKRRS